MQLGMIGLGRMGGNIVRRLLRHGHKAVVYDQAPAAVAALEAEGATGATDLAAFVAHLATPRVVWLMLPAGHVTEAMVATIGPMLSEGDILIDGGNSFYKDDIRRSAMMRQHGVRYLDIGTSGGVWGLERGYCMMVGGDAAAVDHIDPILAVLAPGIGEIPRTKGRDGAPSRAERGYIHAGPSGAGHFVKMVHNGIEYGLMQAYAEGFDILANKSKDVLPEAERFDLDLADIAEVWRRGSVVSSWLLDLAASALAEQPGLETFTGIVEDSGEGRWTINAAIEEAVPANVLSASLYARFRSRETHSFGEKMLSAMRFGFGGHIENSGTRVG